MTPKGVLSSVTDPQGKLTRYDIDPFWHYMKGMTEAGHHTEYDVNGLYRSVTSITDALGRTTTLKFDRSNRPTEVAAGGGRTYTLEYQGGNRQPSVIRGPLGVEKIGHPYLHLSPEKGADSLPHDDNTLLYEYTGEGKSLPNTTKVRTTRSSLAKCSGSRAARTKATSATSAIAAISCSTTTTRWATSTT